MQTQLVQSLSNEFASAVADASLQPLITEAVPMLVADNLQLCITLIVKTAAEKCLKQLNETLYTDIQVRGA